jgi:putative hemolysin
MIVTLLTLGALLAIAMSGYYSGSETGLYCADPLRVRLDSERGDIRARRLARVLEHEHDALSSILVGTNVANYLATILVAALIARTLDVGGTASELYTTVIVTPIIFVFGEVLPKTLFHRDADTLMRAGSLLMRASMWAFTIPVALLNGLTSAVMRWVGSDPKRQSHDPRRGVAALLRGALSESDDADDHIAFVDRVFGLSSVPIHRVMVPHNRVIMIRFDAERKELESLARKHSHSRILVFDATPRRVVGFVQVDALLTDKNWTHIGHRIQRIIELGPHDSVASALLRLQNAHSSVATVVSRSGSLLGLVTLKDLVEELTGELPEW